MATHSSVLAWRIPWTEEPGGLQPIKLQRIGHNGSYLACPDVNEERVGERGEVNGDSYRLLKVKAAQSSPTLWDSMDCSPPGVPGILQARILE